MKTILSILAVTALGGAASAQIVNGDFETGALGPSTTAYANTDITLPAQYLITNYDTVHGSWIDFYDHTFDHTGDASMTQAAGHYMVVNGTDNGSGPTWAQTVSVTPFTEYTLSGWFASQYGAPFAWVEFRVNGVIVNPAFSAPSTEGVWEQHGVTFTTGNVTSISVEIWDSNQQFSGNDYAIDDIALTVTPTPGASAVLAVGALASMRRRRG